MDFDTVPELDSHRFQQLVRVGDGDNVQLAGEAHDHGGGLAGEILQYVRDGCEEEQEVGRGVQGGEHEH